MKSEARRELFRKALNNQESRKIKRDNGTNNIETTDSEIDDRDLIKSLAFEKETELLYALPIFIKPGKHSYFIKYKDESNPK